MNVLVCHIRVRSHTHTYTHAYMPTYAGVRVRANNCAHASMPKHMNNTHTYASVHAKHTLCAYKHTLHTHIPIQTHTYVNIHTCTPIPIYIFKKTKTRTLNTAKRKRY